MQTIVVTGGAGFIGSNLVGTLLEKGYKVICIDNFDDTYNQTFKEENIQPYTENSNFILVRADIRDLPNMTEVFKTHTPQYIIHLAAKADTRDAVQTPRTYISINIDGTLNILELAREYNIQNVVIASSSSVYGNSEQMPWSESETADRPLSPYGMTKRAIELLAYTYHHNFSLNITCLRYFNAYGERNRPGMVPYIWSEKMLKGEEIEISGDGSRKRDYTYVGDVVDATIKAIETPLGFEILNIGNSSPISLKELVTVFEKVIGSTARIKSRPSSKASVESTYADISKAKKLLNWEPKVSIEEGIQKLVTWFKNNRLEKVL